MIYIQPYGPSESAKALAAALRNVDLDTRRLRYMNSNYSGKPDDVVINWGSHGFRPYQKVVKHVVNKPAAVKLAANKLLSFKTLKDAGVPIPRYTPDYLQAIDWIIEDGLVVAARSTLNGHSGEGIVITADSSHLPKAPLYTQFTKSKGEYRVHIWDGEMIDYAKKRRKTDTPPVGIEKSIRSHDNGWIYARKNSNGEAIPVPDSFIDAARAGVSALGLDFGAVDILNVGGDPVVLEINTAPGLVGDTTMKSYVNAIKSHMEKL